MTQPARHSPILIALGGLIILSALFGLGLAAFGSGQLVWPVLLFEPVVLGAGIVAILIGLRIQNRSIPMALATAAACLAAAAFLSMMAGRSTLGGRILVPLMGARLVLAGILGLLAAMLVLGRDTRAYRRVLVGGLLLIAGGALASIAFLGQAKPIRDWLMSLGAFGASAVSLALFVAFVILVSAGTQKVVGTFERALDQPNTKHNPIPSAPTEART